MSLEQVLGLRQIKEISYYQFGQIITEALFQNESHITFKRSKRTNKVKYVYLDDELLMSLRPTNGLFTLGFLAATIIIKNTSKPIQRTIVMSDVSKFIKEGRNVFCKHVVDIDDNLRPMDEVIVVNEEDELLAIGKLRIPVHYVKTFKNGIAIKVRKGFHD